MSRISRWRWHGNAVARAGCLCYVASRWKVLWEALLCRRIMLTGTHASTRLTEERREGLNVCRDVFLFSVCMCVYREECKAWINNVRCAFALRGGYWYIYAKKHPWTCQHACVCVCTWTEEVSVSESNTSICVPGWRLCELSSLWSSEHRHSDETKHAHAEQLSHTAESQVVAPVPLMFSLYSLFVLHKCHFRLGSTVP